jgi:hypothetical protein
MEADASVELKSPVFNMYSVDPSKSELTFHNTWNELYQGTTTVLHSLPNPVDCGSDEMQDI